MPSIQPTASGNECQLPHIFSHSATDRQVTWLQKKCHKTGTILWIIADTVERLISNSRANISTQGYFLSHSTVNRTLFIGLSLHILHLRHSRPLLFNLSNTKEISVVMFARVSGNSPVFNQNRYPGFSMVINISLP